MSKAPANSHPGISKQNFRKACLWGGFITGLIGSSVIFITSVFWDVGYDKIKSTTHFKEYISIVVCILQISLGGLLGWICYKFSWPDTEQYKSVFKQTVRICFIFVIAFITIISFRQLMTRDALVKPNSYDEIIDSTTFLKLKREAKNYTDLYAPDRHPETNQLIYVRKGGGYLGEPDFESLATGLMGGIAFLVLVLKLSNSFSRKGRKEKPTLSIREMLVLTAKAAFAGFVGWMAVYLIYLFLTRTTSLIEKYDFIYARWVFVFDFPHPRRYFVNFLFCAVYLFSFLASIRLYSNPQPAIFWKIPFLRKIFPYKDQPGIKTVKIFLASSVELAEDRKALRQFISVENDRLYKAGIYLEIVQWEYFFDAMSDVSLNDEYIQALKKSDIFLSLFYIQVGKFTLEEFEAAYAQFKKKGKPYIYTYFKKTGFESDVIKEQDIKQRQLFEEKLLALGHFKTEYKDINDLLNHFKRQLDSLLPKLKLNG